jgi:hypothetical protein
MRCVSLLLASLVVSLLSFGCGMSGGHDPMFSMGSSPPSIATLTPNSVPVNSVPFTITIDGSNFGADAVVFWHGNAHMTTFVSAKEITTTLTDTDLMFTGLVPVYVRTGGLNSNTVEFDVSAQ